VAVEVPGEAFGDDEVSDRTLVERAGLVDVAVLDGGEVAGDCVILHERDDAVPELRGGLGLLAAHEEEFRVDVQQNFVIDGAAFGVEVPTPLLARESRTPRSRRCLKLVPSLWTYGKNSSGSVPPAQRTRASGRSDWPGTTGARSAWNSLVNLVHRLEALALLKTSASFSKAS